MGMQEGISMARQGRKPTIGELKEAMEGLMEAHNNLVTMVMAMNHQMEQMSTVMHLAMVEQGLAEIATCSGCGYEVIFPSGLSEHIATHPVCPNSEDSEDCLHGFSHIERPSELEEDAPTLYDFEEEE